MSVSMRLYGVVLLLLLLLAGVASLFWVQNSARTATLSLDLGLAAWQLARPVPIPALMAICAGSGMLLGLAVPGMAWLRARGEVRRLKAQAALSNDSLGGAPRGWR